MRSCNSYPAFTASVTTTERNRITQAGFSAFVSKPINVKEFLATVKRMLGVIGP